MVQGDARILDIHGGMIICFSGKSVLRAVDINTHLHICMLQRNSDNEESDRGLIGSASVMKRK